MYSMKRAACSILRWKKVLIMMHKVSQLFCSSISPLCCVLWVKHDDITVCTLFTELYCNKKFIWDSVTGSKIQCKARRYSTVQVYSILVKNSNKNKDNTVKIVLKMMFFTTAQHESKNWDVCVFYDLHKTLYLLQKISLIKNIYIYSCSPNIWCGEENRTMYCVKLKSQLLSSTLFYLSNITALSLHI